MTILSPTANESSSVLRATKAKVDTCAGGKVDSSACATNADLRHARVGQGTLQLLGVEVRAVGVGWILSSRVLGNRLVERLGYALRM